MPAVEIVHGPVEMTELGPPALMREHVFVLGTEHAHYGAGGWWDEEKHVDELLRPED